MNTAHIAISERIPMYTYTICFLMHQNEFLLLNRRKPPLMGRWNGVGGKLAPNESPFACVLREVFEETGIPLTSARYKGIVSWKLDRTVLGGMYAFVAELPDAWERFDTPRRVEEGILDWVTLDWILHPDNEGIAENVPRFLPYMLENDEPVEHAFTYEGGRVIGYERVSLLELSPYLFG